MKLPATQRMRCIGGYCTFCCILFLTTLSIAVYMGIDWYLYSLRITTHNVYSSMELNADFRIDIANKLHELTLQIKNEAKDIKPSILLDLDRIISQLDPRFALSSGKLLVDTPLVPDTCGEVFNGTLYGYPWFRTGFVKSPSCNMDEKLPIHKLVTILILDQFTNINKTTDLLQSIYNYNPEIHIILGSTASVTTIHNLKAKYKYLTAIECDQEDLHSPGKILNIMMNTAKTRYILIARDMFFFNDLARLERQVFVISSTSMVGVAGGSFRNESGYWKVGCHLSKIRNYFLKYTTGYKHSAFDCMICDHLEGPFVTKTSFLKKIPFKTNLNIDVLFEDWFLRVKQNNILTMNCPDVLYFKRGPLGVEEETKIQAHSSWLQLAREWQVDHIYYPSRISVKFSCKELKIKCKTREWAEAFLIPTCCMEQVTGAMNALDRFTQEKGLDYEIEAGTLLGAVKLGNFLPWDKDGDISVLNKDLDTYYKNRDYFSEQGFHLSSFKDKYFKLNTPEIKIEMWGSNELSTFQLPPVMRQYPTRVKFNGIWVRGEWNPGLFIRNRYGPNFLKHAQHWIVLDMDNSWQLYKPGSWISCPMEAHHGCLDLYPTDGSEGLLPDN